MWCYPFTKQYWWFLSTFHKHIICINKCKLSSASSSLIDILKVEHQRKSVLCLPDERNIVITASQHVWLWMNTKWIYTQGAAGFVLPVVYTIPLLPTGTWIHMGEEILPLFVFSWKVSDSRWHSSAFELHFLRRILFHCFIFNKDDDHVEADYSASEYCFCFLH